MSKRARACVVMRPDASGNLVQVAVQRSSGAPCAVRSGVFVAWHGWSESVSAEGSLAVVAEAICRDPDLRAYYTPARLPLNRAELAQLQSMVKEGSE